jgi:opacity protein-like surface antigen
MLEQADFELVDRAADADAVVTGKVERAKGRYLVRIEVRDYSGEVIANVKMRLRNKGFTKKKTFRKIARKLKAGVEEAKANADRVAAAEKDSDDEDEDEDESDDEEDEDEKKSVKASADSDSKSSGTAMTGRLGAGVSFVGRDLAIGANGDDVASYDGIYAPGVRIDAELLVRGKYVVEAYLDRAVGLKSGLRGAGETPLATTQSRFGAAGYYRYAFGASKKAYVQAGAGLGQMEFSIADDGMAVEVPDVVYTYVEPSVGLNVPLTPRVSAVAKGGVMLVLSAGELVDQAHYGSASMIGYDVLIGADVALSPNLGIRAGISYTRVDLTFDGNGQMTATAGASDTFAGGFVTGAYSF